MRDGFLTGAAVFTLALLCVGWIYLQAHQAQHQSIQDELKRLARLAARHIDPELHRQLTSPDQTGGPLYREAISDLAVFHRTVGDLHYCYTAILQEDQVYFVLDTAVILASESARHDLVPSRIMDRYKTHDPDLLAAFDLAAPTATRRPLPDEFGIFMSGFAPVFDHQGRLVAVAGVDMEVTDYLARTAAIRGAALGTVFLAALVSLAIGYGIWRSRRQAEATQLWQRESEERGEALIAELARNQSMLKGLAEINRTLLAPADFTDCLRAVLERLGRLTEASASGLIPSPCAPASLPFDFGGSLVWTDPSRPAAHRKHPDIGAFLSGDLPVAWQNALSNGDLIQFSGEDFEGHPRFATANQPASLLLAPVHAGDVWIATLWLADSHEIHTWCSEQVSTIGSVASVLGLAIERKAGESALIQARDEAEAGDRAKTEFLAVISHEIRTPLNGILGFAHLLMDTPLTADQRECIETVLRSGQGLLRIIDDVLDYSRMEAGSFQLQIQPVDLHQALADALAVVAHQARTKTIDLTLQAGDGVPRWIQCDPVRLRQILLNLLTNAVKFTAKNGSIALHTRREAAPDDPARSWLCISISDTGIGMTAAQQQRLFRMFSQADSSTTRRFGGTGVGLAVSQRLAGLLGGEITVASEAGRGSTFTLALPLVEADAPAESGQLFLTGLEPAAAPQPSQSSNPIPCGRESTHDREGILVAEDNLVNQRVLQLLLRKAGYDPVLVANGREAVDAFAQGRFQLVLMDVQMPVMDGIEAATEIRRLEAADPERRPCRIVAVTAGVLAAERTRARKAGMDGFLTKPIRPSELNEEIERTLGQSAFAGTSA
ncbi:MAG: response regulator [Puniceicoccaceae bacterium]|nr:MAG: response regulator [Puniceicoccaceae bacterium]